jgi:hypothetical protein
LEMLRVASARFAPVRALSYRSVVTLTCAKAEAANSEVRKIRKVLTQNHDLPKTVRVGNPRLDIPLETCSEQPGINENNLRKAIIGSKVIGPISALCVPNPNLSANQPKRNRLNHYKYRLYAEFLIQTGEDRLSSRFSSYNDSKSIFFHFS